MARKLAAVAFSLGCLHAGSVLALGLGELELKSFLNEPLRASVDLLNMEGLHEDEVRVRLATTEDFEKLGLERAYFLTNITFEVIPNGQGGARIQIRSEDPVLEPYLDFIVEARWPSGRLLREYTVLVDPPIYSQSTPVVSASARVAETDGVPEPAKKNETFNYSYEENRRVNSGARTASAPVAARRDAGTLEPGSRYRISPDQTLWQIASAAKPSGVSVHQTMLDIQRLNPDAFINGNINRIKAGYVIYLPSSEDISSADLPSALAEVREQNTAWREGRDEAAYASSGPSLRISAEPEDAVETASRDVGSASSTSGSSSSDAAQLSSSSAVVAGSDSGDTLDRLAALEQQLATLQRIVSLKDDQIAALQGALKDAGGVVSEVASEELSSEELVSEEATALIDSAVETEVEGAMADDAAAAVDSDSEQSAQAAPAVEAEPKVAPTPAKDKTPAPSPVAVQESWGDYLLYGLGALILAAAAFVFMRRRGEVEEEAPVEAVVVPVPPPVVPQEDIFADVRLHDQNLEVETSVDEPLDADTPNVSRDNRGYGEHKHDEYASDVDAADALAEADIYIAYGRHPQAIELLKNALSAEPGNPVYRLKMLEIYTEQDNRVAATAQLEKIEESGDPESIERAYSLMSKLDGDDEIQASVASAAPKANRGPGLSPNPLEMFAESDVPLEDDFSGLEIENLTDAGGESDLDLSGDFAAPTTGSDDGEDLVIAADSNALSTKLDLARAYMDMGDDDGARQILDEVVAEGSDELKAEALDLLERIG